MRPFPGVAFSFKPCASRVAVRKSIAPQGGSAKTSLPKYCATQKCPHCIAQILSSSAFKARNPLRRRR
jgi:hypothetical protein